MKVDLQLRWLTTDNFRITKQLEVVAYQLEISSKHKKKNTKLRWLASDIDFKPQHTGYPIAHGIMV